VSGSRPTRALSAGCGVSPGRGSRSQRLYAP